MKNIFFLILISFSLFSCAKHGTEDPLLLPPNFNEMPNLNEAKKPEDQKPNSADVEELRDLLLKSQ